MNSVIKNYIDIARPDHWVKHIFIIPGVVLAFLFIEKPNEKFLFSFLMGFTSAFFIASGNYVINEWLDRSSDKFHPLKKKRPAALGLLKAKFVYFEYIFLIFIGLIIAWYVSIIFFLTAIIFFISGLIYNVPPIRFKEWIFLDVMTESINNPIRLTMGWNMVSPNTLPPLSLFIFYWFGGAFLMAIKRLAEYRYVTKQGLFDDLVKYRGSFRLYTENSLLTSSFLYAILSSFFLSAFLIKYRNEFLFVFPFFALLFTYYLSIGLREASIAQNPQKLHKDKWLIIIVFTLVASFAFFSIVDIPIAHWIIESKISAAPNILGLETP